MSEKTIVAVEGRDLALSNLDKVLYPATGFTKGEVIDYYVRASSVLLPHLVGRSLTLKRYPNGVEQPYFYEKRCPPHAPDWIVRAPGEIPFCVLDGLASLVWVANLASLELHPALGLAGSIEEPTVVAFDLDPGPPAGILECAAVALDLHAMFGQLGLECFAKTSGSKGMQVYLPLNSGASYEQTRPFAKAVAETLERGAPDRVVSRMAKERRAGRVLVDWNQNGPGRTTIAVYSLRAMPTPTVSTPITWAEVSDAVDRGEERLLAFDAAAVLEQIEAIGDPFAPVATLVQRLPAIA